MNLLRPLLLVLLLVGGFTSVNGEPLSSVVNFHTIDEDLMTAGQLLPEHIEAVASARVDLVINLATADKERNGEEGFLLIEQGIDYIHIPVIWDSPTQADLDLFFAVMDARQDRKTLVHCFANYRASAFTYLYRVLRLGVDEAEARKDLEAVWDTEAFETYPKWRTFVDQQLHQLPISNAAAS